MLKFPKIKKPKLTDKTKKLDKLFSEYIRLRDTENGYGRCVTCGKLLTYQTMDCGHFISRNKHSVRWDERNANGQCQKCNRFLSGKQFEHGLAINKIYKSSMAEDLLSLSKMNIPIDHDKLIAYYKLKIKELKDAKN